MSGISAKVFMEVLHASAEPVLVVRTDHPDWPVRFANAACSALAKGVPLDGAFADVVEALFGRDVALDIAEAIRGGDATRLTVDHGGNDVVVIVQPQAAGSHCAVFLRNASAAGGLVDEQGLTQELATARRRIRDLKRDDLVTGLLNRQAFTDMLAHDWAVASREKTTLALVHFVLVDFADYVEVFGRHASDSCLRRTGQAIRRCLRRASDVVARFDDESFIVLSHASDEDGVSRFAARIADAVRELGLHHPRSKSDRFVTVEHRSLVTTAGADGQTADEFMRRVTERK